MITRLKTLCAQGMSFDRIAATLNTEEVRTRVGQRWHGTGINRILAGKALR